MISLAGTLILGLKHTHPKLKPNKIKKPPNLKKCPLRPFPRVIRVCPVAPGHLIIKAIDTGMDEAVEKFIPQLS